MNTPTTPTSADTTDDTPTGIGVGVPSEITTVSIPDGKDGDFLTLAEASAILRTPSAPCAGGVSAATALVSTSSAGTS